MADWVMWLARHWVTEPADTVPEVKVRMVAKD